MTNLIKSARLHAEKYLNRALVTQTWYYYLDELFDVFEIPLSPISEISSITYYDNDNELQTLDTDYYDVDIVGDPARIIRAYGCTYPGTYDKQNAVIVEFISGYGAAANVPEEIKTGMLLYITYLYEHRGDESIRPPRAIYDLWKDYKVFYL